MCKINLKDYDAVIDQCERVLEHDPNNVKANFRMSQAAYKISAGKNASKLKAALKYAEIANKGQPSNSQIKSHLEQVKQKHSEVIAAQEERKTAAPKPTYNDNGNNNNLASESADPTTMEQ